MLRRDEGVTLVELVVATALTALFLAITGTVTVSVIRGFGRVQDESLTADRGRVVLDRLDRDLRQVSSVNLPRAVSGRTYLEYLTGALVAGTTASCTQWRWDPATARLDVRRWPVGATSAGAWGTVASGVVNDPVAQPPFTVAPASGTAARQALTVELRLRLANGSATTRATVVARNSSTGSPSNADADGDKVSDTEVCTTFGRP